MKFFTLIPVAIVALTSCLPAVNAYWKPKPGLKWNWALGTKVSEIPIENTDYEVIDIDLYGATKEIINKMHSNNKKVICYFSAGTYEKSREEAQGMLKVNGLVRNKMEEWDEYWLDFRLDEVKSFMIERLELAKSKGCDGIEFDNVDTFTNVDWDDAITVEDQLKYDKWLATEAHNRNMAAGFKNSIELLDDLKDIFDFAINEECNEYNECDDYSVFLNKNIAVFVALYGYPTDKTFMNGICSQVKGLNLSIIIKDPSESLTYDYTAFEYEKFCGSSSTTKKTTTTTKKTTTTTTAKKTTTTTPVKKTTTSTKKTTTATKKTTTTTKKATTTIKKTTTKKTTTKKSTTSTKKSSTTKKTTKTSAATKKCSIVVSTVTKCD
ncbi:hypothetical protein BCR36DRAFT_583849 [Piromyces finnis]|uniref:alpha-galactosidase n=1 Tax=Piromyces finnis TaxID=1754191 RepID=A0A1Y1V7H9_9FUNG|nr:hypothetical protein BCR36DRAFT_583849 [Piromyces finnis]|eukprot:ORX49245.1 hypothetical protein BCR36DRAFT_583849 [Piromyces finnis]